MSSECRELTCEELNRSDGKDGRPAYVAHEGKVYDVSASKYWRAGLHMKRHAAGGDLSAEIHGAPHGPEVFDRIPQVGTLKPEKDPHEKDPIDEVIPGFLLALFERVPMLRRHPHPMTVHFPLAFVMIVPLFNLLYLLTGYAPFEATAFHCLVLSFIATVVAMLTGPYTWWVNYGRKWSFNIKVKMSFSSLLFVLLLIALCWRVVDPNVMLTPGGARMICLLLSLSLVPCVTVLGWFGAKMTFPH